MSHSQSYEELAGILHEAENVYAAGSIIPSLNRNEPQRRVCMHALDEETLKAGIVYEVENKPGTLRFCPLNQINTAAVGLFDHSVSTRLLGTPPVSLDGTFWRHTKTGGLYRIIQTAMSDLTGSKGVLYYPRGHEPVRFFRPLLSFLGQVEIDGEVRQRFEQISITEFDGPQAHG